MDEEHVVTGSPDLYAEENRKDNEKLARALAPRLIKAKTTLSNRIVEADEYEQYLDGRGIYNEDMNDNESTYHFTDFPLHYQLKSALVPMLVSRWPKWMVSNLHAQQDSPDPEFEGFRRILEALLDKLWHEYDLQQQLRYAVEETIPLGMSAFVVGWDPVKRLPMARWVSGREILIDPDGGPMPSSWRWVAEWRDFPLEELRARYPKFEWETAETEPEDVLPIGPGEKEVQSPGDEMTETKRLYIVYKRNDMPTFGEMPGKASKGGKSQGEVILMTDEDEPKVVDRYPWPWVFDVGDWPMEIIRFTFDTKMPHPTSMLRPGHSLQEQASWNLTFFNTAMRLSVIRKVLVNTSYIADDELDLLESPTDLEFIQVDDPAAFAAVNVISFMDQFPQALSQNLQANAEIYREIMGVNEIIRESKSHTTAVDVSLQEQRAQQRLGVYIAQVERLVTNVARKLIQVAMYMMSAEDLTKWLGDLVNSEATPEGIVSAYWAEDGYSAEEIRLERSIRVEPDSLRHVSKDQRVQEMGMMMDRVTQAMGLMKDLGLPLSPVKIAEVQMNFLKRLADEVGIQNVDELFPKNPQDLFEALPPTGALPPEAAAGTLPGEGGTAPGGPPVNAPAPAGVNLPGPVPGPGGAGGAIPGLPPEAMQALGVPGMQG